MTGEKSLPDRVEFPEGIATEKIVRRMLVEVGLQAHEHGLADFAVDQCFEDARKRLRKERYTRPVDGPQAGDSNE